MPMEDSRMRMVSKRESAAMRGSSVIVMRAVSGRGENQTGIVHRGEFESDGGGVGWRLFFKYFGNER